MIKYIKLLITILIVLNLKSYSQCIDSLKYKEIKLYLAEGLEAKELLIEKNNKLKDYDTVIIEFKDQIKDLNDQNILLKDNNNIIETQKVTCIKDLNLTNNNLIKANKKVEIWKTSALIEGFLIFLGIIGTYLIIR